MIYVIVGPTAVGKTSFSILLAERIGNAEIINADSMQVYKELNIGVAKITNEETHGILHHLLSYKSVNDEYSVKIYQEDGRRIINKLINENKNVIIVGGTGLYIKALLYDYNFNNKPSNKKLYNFKIIGLTKNRKTLYDRINSRVDLMFENGLINEVRNLYNNNSCSRVVTRCAIGYKELFEYFNGSISLEDAKDKIKLNSRRYAKRQFTFFNNQFEDICWYDTDVYSLIDIIKKIV